MRPASLDTGTEISPSASTDLTNADDDQGPTDVMMVMVDAINGGRTWIYNPGHKPPHSPVNDGKRMMR